MKKIRFLLCPLRVILIVLISLDVLTNSVAELTVGLLIATARRFGEGIEAIKVKY